MKSSKVFLNDKFLNLSEAKISPLDRGFIFAIANIRGGQVFGKQSYENVSS